MCIYIILYYTVLYQIIIYILHCTILLQLYKVIFHHSICVYVYLYVIIYKLYCLISFLLVGVHVIVGHYGIFQCAASLKSLQGIKVHFHFAVFQRHCKLLLITLLIKINAIYCGPLWHLSMCCIPQNFTRYKSPFSFCSFSMTL